MFSEILVKVCGGIRRITQLTGRYAFRLAHRYRDAFLDQDSKLNTDPFAIFNNTTMATDSIHFRTRSPFGISRQGCEALFLV
jgi:hypothetical protein